MNFVIRKTLCFQQNFKDPYIRSLRYPNQVSSHTDIVWFESYYGHEISMPMNWSFICM